MDGIEELLDPEELKWLGLALAYKDSPSVTKKGTDTLGTLAKRTDKTLQNNKKLFDDLKRQCDEMIEDAKFTTARARIIIAEHYGINPMVPFNIEPDGGISYSPDMANAMKDRPLNDTFKKARQALVDEKYFENSSEEDTEEETEETFTDNVTDLMSRIGAK
jgi:hypothetical protein